MQDVGGVFQRMRKTVIICLVLAVSVAALAALVWPHPFGTRHYSVDELVGLSCKELGAAHEEVVFAYHDASMARYNRTGTFQDDLGLPEDAVLPFVILMKQVIRDNDLRGFDLTKPFFHSASAATPRLHSDFYAEITAVCAASPAMDAIEAMMRAATTLELTRGPGNP